MKVKLHEDRPGTGLTSETRDYRAFVGPPEKYDLVGAMQLNLLSFLGLREHHFLLDIGCGSLRAGRLFIPYLMPGRYFGIEPEEWLVQEGIEKELGRDLIKIKRPVFSSDTDFSLSVFNRKFDFLLAQSIFSHASQPQIRRCLSEAKKVMGPTAMFAATFFIGEESYAGDEWVYPGCVTYTLEHMKGLVEEAGLVCKPIDWHHPNSQTWIVIVNPENEKNVPDLGNIPRLPLLEKELRLCKERISKLEGHPYVRLGFTISRLLKLARLRK